LQKKRKTPLRRCTGCGLMKSKRELVRVVRNDAGEFFLDSTGKKAGRGAYVCPSRECLARAHKSKGLERSFRQAVPAEIYEALRAEMENLPEHAGETPGSEDGDEND